MKLTNASLFKQSCYINGKWIQAKKTINVNNPATEDILGTVPDLEPENILNAITAADSGLAVMAIKNRCGTWRVIRPLVSTYFGKY